MGGAGCTRPTFFRNKVARERMQLAPQRSIHILSIATQWDQQNALIGQLAFAITIAYVK